MLAPMTKRKNNPGGGRPPFLTDGHRVNLYLSHEHIAIAMEIGQGNKSEGVRLALELAKKALKV